MGEQTSLSVKQSEEGLFFSPLDPRAVQSHGMFLSDCALCDVRHPSATWDLWARLDKVSVVPEQGGQADLMFCAGSDYHCLSSAV